MGLTDEEQAKSVAKGWKVGTVSEFLGLTPDEEVAVEERLHSQLAQQPGLDQTDMLAPGRGHGALPLDAPK